MKKILIATTLLIAFTSAEAESSQTWDIYKGDTVNYTDANGRKQGHWIYWYTTGGQKKEEGEYKNSRKEGIWTKYYENGNTWSEITYKNNKAAGPYTTYFSNGQTEEQGNFYAAGKGKNTGEFMRWYEDGTVAQEKTFNDDGATDGEQKIYYENGQLAVEWNSNNGVESGTLTRYWENGDTKEVVEYDASGEITAQNTFDMVNAEVVIDDGGSGKTSTTPTNVQENGGGNNYATAGLSDGEHTLYNPNFQVAQKGYFEGGRLKNGEIHVYDEDGLKVRIEIYKNFEYIGNGVIDE